MKLHIKYKDGTFNFVEVDWVGKGDGELTYYQGEDDYNDFIDDIEKVSLDGEIIYRDEELTLDIKQATKTLMNIYEMINEGIEEYLKEQENVK